MHVLAAKLSSENNIMVEKGFLSSPWQLICAALMLFCANGAINSTLRNMTEPRGIHSFKHLPENRHYDGI